MDRTWSLRQSGGQHRGKGGRKLPLDPWSSAQMTKWTAIALNEISKSEWVWFLAWCVCMPLGYPDAHHTSEPVLKCSESNAGITRFIALHRCRVSDKSKVCGIPTLRKSIGNKMVMTRWRLRGRLAFVKVFLNSGMYTFLDIMHAC